MYPKRKKDIKLCKNMKNYSLLSYEEKHIKEKKVLKIILTAF
jgi:hypothetical protein